MFISLTSYVGFNASLLKAAVKALLKDGTFKLPFQPVASAHMITEALLAWILRDEAKSSEFEEALVKLLSTTLRSRVKSLKSQREKMWTSYTL